MYKDEIYITTDKNSIAYVVESQSSKNDNIRKLVEYSDLVKELKNAINKRNILVSKTLKQSDKSQSIER
ncbi:MAG: hypothetical protein AB8U25_04425 [Rickettsiales endosymbiont of Dermacentor nuttalli]